MTHAVWTSRSRFWQLTAVVLWTGLSFTAMAQPATTASVNPLLPKVEKARGGQCVEDPAYMRRNHMTLLKHQRNDTVHGGVRTGKYSLKACVSCHASTTSQSVSAQAGDFCQSCHSYAAVKIDCFECHANQPAAAPARVALTLPTVVTHMQPLLAQEKVKP